MLPDTGKSKLRIKHKNDHVCVLVDIADESILIKWGFEPGHLNKQKQLRGHPSGKFIRQPAMEKHLTGISSYPVILFYG